MDISPLQKKLEYDVELAPGIERIISVTKGQPFTFSTARDGLLIDEESAREVLKYMLEHNIIEEATDGYRFIQTGLLEPE